MLNKIKSGLKEVSIMIGSRGIQKNQMLLGSDFKYSK